MTTIAANLQAVRERIARAARAAGRDPGEVALIAVSKTRPAECITEAYACGQRAFGENHVQEAVEKMAQLSHLALARRVDASRSERERSIVDAHHSAGVASPQAGPLLRPLEWHIDASRSEGERSIVDAHHSAGVASPQTGPLLHPLEWHIDASRSKGERSIVDAHHSAGVASPQTGPLLRPLEWHMIGPIQSNKTRAIAEHFDWVHSVEREKIAVRLNDARPTGMSPLDVLIQVNVSGEASKSGVEPGGEVALAKAIAALPRLRLRGLMAIPEPTPDAALQHRRFALLRELKDGLVRAGFDLDTLSMGMSDDFEVAISEGATMVRVGTAIFGERNVVSGKP